MAYRGLLRASCNWTDAEGAFHPSIVFWLAWPKQLVDLLIQRGGYGRRKRTPLQVAAMGWLELSVLFSSAGAGGRIDSPNDKTRHNSMVPSSCCEVYLRLDNQLNMKHRRVGAHPFARLSSKVPPSCGDAASRLEHPTVRVRSIKSAGRGQHVTTTAH